MTAMRKASAFSMLAETAEEFIQLECARRRSQASLKRRSSLPSQFHVRGHKSRLKEKLAQARRHAFLMRADNKDSVIGIIESVRELANNGEEGINGAESKSPRRNGLSPLEQDRFMLWAAEAEKLLYEFEPSENHADDPMLRILDDFQFLQDGHVCLAEVAMDARALLERWDRAGIFDSEFSSEDDSDNNDEKTKHIHNNRKCPLPDPLKESLRHLEQSYAYRNVRQRAAAGIIKRNVLTWVRSKASFCERVAEIEIFGRTTEALLKELSLTTAALAGVNPSGTTDIFALATGRCDLKSRYSGSIAFKDLLQFSKHMALFPVDQALRTVDDVTRRRYLFDSRCAMKIQSVWRRVRETVRARRLYRALVELRLKRELVVQAKREAAKEMKRRKVSETGKRKVSKAPKRASSPRSSMISSAVSKATAVSTTPVDEEVKEPLKGVTPESRQKSPADPNENRQSFFPPVPLIDPSTHRTSTRGNTTAATEDRLKSPISTPRSRQKKSRGIATTNNDSDDDTADVEAAWKSFMDAVATDVMVQETEGTEAPDEEPNSDPFPEVTLPPMEDTWESWSDDETEDNGKDETEDALGRQSTSSKPKITSMCTTPRVKVQVSVNKSGESETAARHLRRMESKTPRRNQTRSPMTSNTSVIRPPSSLPFDASLHNHAGPYTGAGQLSLVAPFIDADKSKKLERSVIPERKHLYELDFSDVETKDSSVVHIAKAIGPLHELEMPQVEATPSGLKTPDNAPAEVPRTSTRRTTVERLRNITGDQEQSARVRSLEKQENPISQQSVNHDISRTSAKSNQAGYFTYGAQGMHTRREVVLRKGTMVYSPLYGPPEKETTTSVEPDNKELKAWHRSTIAMVPQGLGVPHPPADGFCPRHKRRTKGPRRRIITNDVVDQSQVVDPSAKKSPVRTAKRSELPLLLRRSRPAAHRQREISRSETLPEDDSEDHPEIPAPDANKQMWKRGGDLPELVLAHIRDRVGYTPKSSRQKRKSIIAGRAPPSAGNLNNDNYSGKRGERFDTFSPVNEEGDDNNDSAAMSIHKVNHSPATAGGNEEAPESGEADENKVRDVERDDSIRRKKSEELNEEFRRLHLASREREISCRWTLLTQLQSDADAAAEDIRRRSKDAEQQEHKRMWRRQRRSIKLVCEASDIAASDDVDVSGLHFGLDDEDSGARTRRRLRIKMRDAKTDPFAERSDEDEDEDNSEEEDDEEVRTHLGLTKEEHDAEFQKLLTQYLGLLQCAPAEVARQLLK